MQKEGRIRVRRVKEVYPLMQVLILDGLFWERAIVLSSEGDKHKISYKGKEFYRTTKELQTLVIEYVVEEEFHNPTGTVYFSLKEDQWQEVLDKWEEMYAPVGVPFEIKLTRNPEICDCIPTKGTKECRCSIEIAELIIEKSKDEKTWEEIFDSGELNEQYALNNPTKLTQVDFLLKYLKENYYAPKRIKETKETSP